MEYLQKKINELDIEKTNINEYNKLLEQCAKYHEMNAMVYIYDHMKNNDIKPNEDSYIQIDKLHSKKIYESNKIKLNNNFSGNKLEARRRIHKIMKGYNYSDNYNNALKNKSKVVEYIENNPKIADIENRIALAKNISKNCNISFNDARYIITNLKRTKFLDKQRTKKQNTIESYFKKL